MSDALPAGMILAGGRSRRMGGQTKALLDLNGIPLVQHVVQRLRPQVASLVLSVEQKTASLDFPDLPQVEDVAPGSNGPLGGLLAVMEEVSRRSEWLLMCPCDAPLLPVDLGKQLMQRIMVDGGAVCAVRYEHHIQPTFSLWNCRVLPELRTAVMEDHLGGFRAFFDRVKLSELVWAKEAVSPFFNVNTPQDLEQAATLVDQAKDRINHGPE